MDKLLEYFIKEPEREFYVRELARLIKKSPATVSKYLKEFAKKGILVSASKLNHLLFKANTESHYFKEIKVAHNIGKVRESGLIDYLNKEFNQPEAIVLFGSFAKGENGPKSDIDILVITPVKKTINLKKFEKIMGYEIQLFVHSGSEIERMKTSNKELLNSFINGMVLSGFWEMLK